MPLEICPTCNGKREVPCQKCHGTGHKPDYQPPADDNKPWADNCKPCNATGKIRCTRCSGNGVIG